MSVCFFKHFSSVGTVGSGLDQHEAKDTTAKQPEYGNEYDWKIIKCSGLGRLLMIF